MKMHRLGRGFMDVAGSVGAGVGKALFGLSALGLALACEADEETYQMPLDGSSTAELETSEEGSSSGNGSSSTSAADESSDSNDETPTDCTAIAGSPPPLEFEGKTIVPIDVLAISSKLRFEAGRGIAASARFRFAMGPDDGLPSFDLRQTIESATLDGQPIEPAAFQFFDADGPEDLSDLENRMLALMVELEACTEHEIELTYTLGTPDADLWNNSEPPSAGADGHMFFASHFSDALGHFLDMWIPAPMEHDAFEYDLEVVLDGATEPHAIVSNGDIAELGDHAWSITYDRAIYSTSPLLLIHPTSSMRRWSGETTLPNGQTVAIETYAEASSVTDIEAWGREIESSLVATYWELGDYEYDRFVQFIIPEVGSMEYDGGSTGGFLSHEVFHSWIGRGMRPLTGRDAWLDEAWAMYQQGSGFAPLSREGPPIVLVGSSPWTRATRLDAYDSGARVFATLATEAREPLRGIMRDIYTKYAGEQISTEQLEHELYCAMQSSVVPDTFHRFVYGLDETTPVREMPPCP